MAQRCQICGKGPHYGNVISHANNTRRRRWNPNLRRVRALVNGARKQLTYVFTPQLVPQQRTNDSLTHPKPRQDSTGLSS